MLTELSILFFVIFCILVFGTLWRLWMQRDKSLIWSPITIISLTLIYYIVIPSVKGLTLYGADNSTYQHSFYIASCIFFICVLLGFRFKTGQHFKRWNEYFNQDNTERLGVILFIFSMACYIPFRGFRTTIWAEDAGYMADRTGFVSYFIDLISLFCAACGLSLMHNRLLKGKIKNWIIFIMLLYFSLVIYIVGGFRYRIATLILVLATIYHLFPKPRRINYLGVLVVAVIMYLGFAVMEMSRSYGAGLNRDALGEISIEQASKGADENNSVTCFSIIVIDHYQRGGEYLYFEPLINAVMMPIPRAIFPWKPDGGYTREIQRKTIGTSQGGAAYLCFVEAFVSFGWIGIIIYGVLVGWLSKIFWDNYLRNPSSIGAMLLLALYNGFCYQWISRGYLAGDFNGFMYYVIVPFWLTALFKKILPKMIIHE